VNEIDLRPWTFVSGDKIVSTRVDAAALNADAIRQRLLRDPSAGFATVSGTPARFSRNEIKDPAAAINTIARRGIGSGTGREGSGSATDLTPFFRRDPELSNTVRERIVRSGVVAGGSTAVVGTPRSLPAGSGVPSPGTPGTIEGRVPPHGDSPESPRGVIPRDRSRETPASGTITPPSSIDRTERNWRDRINRTPATPTTPERTPAPTPQRDDGWRGRVTGRRDFVPTAPADRKPVDRGSDIPRRIIDRIGGARIYGGDTPRDTAPRQAPPPRESAPPRVERSSPPPQPSSPPPQHERSSSPPPDRSNEGGHVKRDH